MDPLTHVTSGVLIGRWLKPRFPHLRWFVFFTALAAWIPDIDNITSFWGPQAYMRLHRGITHSLVMVLPIAALTALPFFLARRKDASPETWRSFVSVVGVAVGCLLVHLFLDVITSYGTQLLAPFSNARISLPAVFIIDPFLTLTMLVFVAFSYIRGTRGRYFALLGLAWMLVYPATNISIKSAVTSGYAGKLAAADVSYETLHVQPDGLSPIYWKVILDKGESFELRAVSLLDPERDLGARSWPKPDPDLMRSLAPQSGFLTTYLWFTDFLVVEKNQTDEGMALHLHDLRFDSMSPVMRWARDREGGAPFALTVHVDDTQTVKQLVYSNHGEEIVYKIN
jgi:inner membrane protein